jgi:hypothetical protein
MKLKSAVFAVAVLLSGPLVMGQESGARHRLFARMVIGIGSNAKRTFYTDVKKHPLAWGVPLALQVAIAFSDTGSSCANIGNGGDETGPAHIFVGRHPNCRKLVMLTSTVLFVHANSENWLATNFKAKCDREHADPGSLYNRIDARTHGTSACYWGLPWADTLVLGAYEVPVIRSNIEQN